MEDAPKTFLFKPNGKFAKGTAHGPGWRCARAKLTNAGTRLKKAAADYIRLAVELGDFDEMKALFYSQGRGAGMARMLRELRDLGILELALREPDDPGPGPQRAIQIELSVRNPESRLVGIKAPPMLDVAPEVPLSDTNGNGKHSD